jgi:hypothetical protein
MRVEGMNDGGFALEMACLFLLILALTIVILLAYGSFKFSKWIYNRRKPKTFHKKSL